MGDEKYSVREIVQSLQQCAQNLTEEGLVIEKRPFKVQKGPPIGKPVVLPLKKEGQRKVNMIQYQPIMIIKIWNADSKTMLYETDQFQSSTVVTESQVRHSISKLAEWGHIESMGLVPVPKFYLDIKHRKFSVITDAYSKCNIMLILVGLFGIYNDVYNNIHQILSIHKPLVLPDDGGWGPAAKPVNKHWGRVQVTRRSRWDNNGVEESSDSGREETDYLKSFSDLMFRAEEIKQSFDENNRRHQLMKKQYLQM